MLPDVGWLVNDKRVERIWRREGLKVPYKQPKRGLLWPKDSSCIRLRPERRNHVWTYDFVEDRTHVDVMFSTSFPDRDDQKKGAATIGRRS